MKKIIGTVFTSLALITLISCSPSSDSNIDKIDKNEEKASVSVKEELSKGEEINNVDEEINNNVNDNYTQKDLDEDLKLSIEELRGKYPIGWFIEKFGSGRTCNDGGDPDIYECYPEKYFQELTNKEVISLFVIREKKEEPRITKVIRSVLCDIYNNKENSKWYKIRNILYKKDILKERNWFYENVYQCIPESIPYYKEVLFEKFDQHYHPSYFESDFSDRFSSKILEEYKASRNIK